MTRGILIARCMLAGLGVFVLRQGLQHLSYLSDPAGMHPAKWAWGLGIVLLLGMCGGLFFKLVFDNAGWARRIVADARGTRVSEMWIVAGLRLVAVFCGLLILGLETRFIARAAAFVVMMPGLAVKMIVYRYVDDAFTKSAAEWVRWLADLCTVALGAYLAAGAPHYVCRQLQSAQVVESSVDTTGDE